MRRKSVSILAAASLALGLAPTASLAQAPQSSAGATAPNYSEPITRLQQAAQRLREAVQAMAQQPAGPRRNAAADEAREAILETQRAMVALPPELRSGAAAGSPNYTASMQRLQDAAQRLREAVQAMAQQPAGAGRNKAIEQANQALFDTQQAMIQLPPELRTSQAK